MLRITALYAGLLTLLFIGLAAEVIRRRRADRVSIGSGGSPALERAIRGHGNFAEYVPLALVLMAVAEIQGAGPWRLHFMGIALSAGRLLHGACFVLSGVPMWVRVAGMALTFTALGAGAADCLRVWL